MLGVSPRTASTSRGASSSQISIVMISCSSSGRSRMAAMTGGFPALGLLRGLRPATTPSADDELSLDQTARLATGSVMAVPMFTVNRLTGWASSCARQHHREYAAGFPRGLLGDPITRRRSRQPHDYRRACAAARPRSTTFRAGSRFTGVQPLVHLRYASLSCSPDPSHLAVLAVPALTGLLPPDPASPGSGCPPLHRTAATARRWGPTPHTVQRRLMAHGQIVEVAGEPRAAARPLHQLGQIAAARAVEPS